MEGARERRRNEGNGRVGAMGEERLSFLCIPRPFLHAAEVFYAWRPVHAPAAGITLARSARKEIWVLGVSPLLAN